MMPIGRAGANFILGIALLSNTHPASAANECAVESRLFTVCIAFV